MSGCTVKQNAPVGMAMGMVVGGVAGGFLGSGAGAISAGIITGAVVGFMSGYAVDTNDQALIDDALFYNQTHQMSSWFNILTGVRFYLSTQSDTFLYKDVLICRKYHLKLIQKKKILTNVSGVACMDMAGHWYPIN